ncbi:MAG: hypothetical protein GTO45_05390 [Candidatus Aminicenantes bacterium]|nr:hypothetical protein [Candidatus Aminicenantes bacterium]NIM78182.1 hypothetical protein [Candidatus Aminicenantes bacterium]NIN17519.1 hypothetical protein [Candidatus Aminicenantes bacterium]NIN41405.1 hypothetical protein [Candidatus Aminicenantes bacterium]NIN84171.1 hypothetical protein [Candidatus Aminicenantes bacterium]
MNSKACLIFSMIFLLIFFVGCKSSSNVDRNGNGNGNGAIQNPSFANDIQPIFTSGCALAGCHNAASASAGLVLDQGAAYANIVNVASSQEPNLMLVLPSDADNSYIVIKLEGRQNVGVRMPASGSITGTQLQNIKNWINNGAQNN